MELPQTMKRTMKLEYSLTPNTKINSKQFKNVNERTGTQLFRKIYAANALHKSQQVVFHLPLKVMKNKNKQMEPN